MNKLIWNFTVLILVTTSSAISDDFKMRCKLPKENIPHILKMAKETKNYEVLLKCMKDLIDIGNERATAAFTDILKSKILISDLPVTPFVALASNIEIENDTKGELVLILQEMFDGDLSRLDKILVAGALAKHGNENYIGYLIDEYNTSSSILTMEEEHFLEYTVEQLCKINHPKASQFVVNKVQMSNDPVLRLSTIGWMLESDDPNALLIARNNISVESEDFDFIEAKVYLQAIIKFGDYRDKDFLNSLNKNSERLFGNIAEKVFGPLLIDAYNRVDKADTQSSLIRIAKKGDERAFQNVTSKPDKVMTGNGFRTDISDASADDLKQKDATDMFLTTTAIFIIFFIFSIIGVILIRRYFNTKSDHINLK